MMVEKAVSITVSRSRWLFAYLIFIHLFIGLIIVSLVSNIWLSLCAVAILSASFIYYCQRHQWLKSQRALMVVSRDDKHNWQIRYTDGTLFDKLILKHCIATSNLVILNFIGTLAWNGKSVVLLVDAVDAELFRQLRIYLRDPKIFQK